MRSSPSIHKLKEVSVLGINWTNQEAIDEIFPFIKVAQVLEKFNIENQTLFRPDLMANIAADEEIERIIEVLYHKKELQITNEPEWFKGHGNLSRLA